VGGEAGGFVPSVDPVASERVADTASSRRARTSSTCTERRMVFGQTLSLFVGETPDAVVLAISAREG
jgi:hypothetical protein